MKMLNARLEDKLMEQLEGQAVLEKRSKSDLIRQALVEYLDKSVKEYKSIPNEMLVRLEYLNQITQYGDSNRQNWELLREEVKSLCHLVETKPSG